LTYYDHVHPIYDGNTTFTTTLTLPKEGTYNLYLNYSTPEVGEQQSLVTITTAQGKAAAAQLSPDQGTKTIANTYSVELSPSGTFKKSESQTFTYRFTDLQTNQPITDLEPYLDAFGHLIIVSEDSKQFLHVHPVDVPHTPDDRGGPTVSFATFINKTGKYKLFAQFKRNGEVFLTEFVVEVK
jgi:hypothetical protein